MPGCAGNPFEDGALTKALIIGLFLAGGALLLFAWLAEEVREQDTRRFDERVRALVHRGASPPLTRAMWCISVVGSPAAMIVLSVAASVGFWRTGRARAAHLLLMTLAGAALLHEVLKLSFRRTRPPPFFTYPEPASFSFPSGHALFSFCCLGMLALLVTPCLRQTAPRAMVWLGTVLLVGAIGFSRIYLGVHYPTDVLGGYLAAFIVVTAITLGDHRYRRRRRQS